MADMADKKTAFADLAELERLLASVDSDLALLAESIGGSLAGLPVNEVPAAVQTRAAAKEKQAVMQAFRAELVERIAGAQAAIAELERAEREAYLRELDAETTVAAAAFIARFRTFLADLDAFRTVYFRNREAGVKREWPVTVYDWTLKRAHPWRDELAARLGTFEKALARAEAGDDGEE